MPDRPPSRRERRVYRAMLVTVWVPLAPLLVWAVLTSDMPGWERAVLSVFGVFAWLGLALIGIGLGFFTEPGADRPRDAYCVRHLDGDGWSGCENRTFP